MNNALNLYNHRLTLKVGTQEYLIAIRSFNHKGRQLYQASVREGVYINYQTQSFERSEIFRSLKNLFRMYSTTETIE